jgi:hypothetical protein
VMRIKPPTTSSFKFVKGIVLPKTLPDLINSRAREASNVDQMHRRGRAG